MLLLIILFSPWTWEIWQENVFIWIVLISAILFLSKMKRISILFLLLLIFLQWKSTNITSLTHLDDDGIRIQQMRLNEYPPLHISLFEKNLWIPAANWFEGRKEFLVFMRLQQNFFETIDINQYFFASHPRERVGFREFEKFPYIFLPFFIIGIIGSRFYKDKLLLLFLILPITFSTLVGTNNKLGVFSLYPTFIIIIKTGILSARNYLKGVEK